MTVEQKARRELIERIWQEIVCDRDEPGELVASDREWRFLEALVEARVEQ